MASDLENRLKRAAARGVPLTFTRTADMPDAARRIAAAFPDRAIVIHDCVRGFTGANDAAARAVAEICGNRSPDSYANATEALAAATSAPPRTVLIALGADRWIGEPSAAMAALLMRDPYASQGCMLAMLGSAYSPPPELGADVLIFDDSPPDEGGRIAIVRSIADDAGLACDDATLRALVSSTRGLSAFAASQTIAQSVERSGFDTTIARKVWTGEINATKGLTVLGDGDTVARDDVAGLDAWQGEVSAMQGSDVDSILFVDEIEKVISNPADGGARDGGASSSILGSILGYMEDRQQYGAIFVGPPGVGKSYAAKAAGSMLGVPTIQFKPAELKGSYVGESEANAARAMQTLGALCPRALWIATSNGLAQLPPELLRRYTLGIWFFDLPDAAERRAIWEIHLRSNGFQSSDRWTDDDAWTGSDIRNVCVLARITKRTIAQVARRHVPSSRASAELTERLRTAAAGRYYSASYEGAYRKPQPFDAASTGRRFGLEGQG